MAIASDVAILGTGLAPLLAAQILERRGRRVALLNPDHDFFHENSELPLEPILAGDLTSSILMDRVALQRAERAVEILRPEFPGSIESWPTDGRSTTGGASAAFRDPAAPHVRARNWNWIFGAGPSASPASLDEAFLKFLERGWNPVLSQGIAAARKFPAINLRSGDFASLQALTLGRLVDVDLDRYRNGILEFVRNRLSAEAIFTSVSSVEIAPGGLRFYHRGAPVTVSATSGVWVFWTPRLTPWIEKVALARGQEKLLPRISLRGWEQWSLRSREAMDSRQVGLIDNAVLWARAVGEPREPMTELSVLRSVAPGSSFASLESFEELSRLAGGQLGWEGFTIRNLRTRWLTGLAEAEYRIEGKAGDPPVRILSGAEGGLVGVVDRVQRFCSGGDS